jgi:peroxiredoxin family protein
VVCAFSLSEFPLPSHQFCFSSFLHISLSLSFEMETDPYQFPGDQVDMDFPIHGDDPAGGEAFSSGSQQQSSEHSEVVESSDTFAAPMRRRQTPRTLPTDSAIELRNKELADWTKNYRQNMKAAAQKKIQIRIAGQARKNAEHYVWGSGIGDIGQRILSGQGSSPFDMFIGDNLFETITGLSRNKPTRAKHDRDSGIDDATQEESRRVRQKTGEPEVGRSADDEDLPMLGDDDIAIELPREGVSALDDQQIFSAMPWNISASNRGSSAIPRSGRVGMMGSTDQSRPKSRLVSASPLHGRGQPIAFEGLKNFTSDVDYGGDEFGLSDPSSDDPELVVQEPSARVREALSTEGENFIAFMNERIVEKRERAQADLQHMSDVFQSEAAADVEEITFEELLPPTENTKVIACQGFMMLLGLGSKGMLDVQQPRHLGMISLKLTQKAKAMHAVNISDGDESDDDDIEEDDGITKGDKAADPQGIAEQLGAQDQETQEHDAVDGQEGQFQEQFAAGHAAQEDDHDSLYDD